MSISESIRKNSKSTAIGAVIVLILAGLLILNQTSTSATSRYNQPKWMFDLNTKQLAIAEASTYAPHDNGSGTFDYGRTGPAGSLVDAMVYSCGSPTDIKEGMTIDDLNGVDAHIVYLFRGVSNTSTATSGQLTDQEARIVSRSDGAAWFGQFTQQGQDVQNNFPECSDGSSPVRTRP
ncbi:MAG: hypothetical protein AAGH99_11370 [Planctomycetota bacterium]